MAPRNRHRKTRFEAAFSNWRQLALALFLLALAIVVAFLYMTTSNPGLQNRDSGPSLIDSLIFTLLGIIGLSIFAMDAFNFITKNADDFSRYAQHSIKLRWAKMRGMILPNNSDYWWYGMGILIMVAASFLACILGLYGILWNLLK
jgi:hypothetical protein